MHKITIDLVGLGGTGSQVLTGMARLNEALLGLNHPGLLIRAWDPDIVSESNMGRQLFSASDLNMNKATVLITRINRFFGTEWLAMAEKYNAKLSSNILITCVDSAKERLTIADKVKSLVAKSGKSPVVNPTDERLYWLDIGNLQKTGQVLLGTLQRITQPKVPHKCKQVLPTVEVKFPQLKKIIEKDLGPSCSIAEALEKQDLFINSTLANFGCNMIWKLLREGHITVQGCYVNLQSLIVNPIKIL